MLAVVFAAMLALGLGVAFLLVGYRVFLVMLPIWGFLSGLWLGAQAVSTMLGEGLLASTTSLIAGGLTGIFFAAFAYLFYNIGVALIAAGFGAAMGTGLMAAIGLESGLIYLLVGLAGAVGVAVLTLLLNLQKYTIIGITAMGGASAVILAPLLLFGRVSLDALQQTGSAIQPILQDSWFWLIAWLILAAAGFVIQIRANRDFTFDRTRLVEGWG